MYFIYILYSKSLDRYYIGSTGNIDDRLNKHLSIHRGFTGKAKDWELKYTEEFSNKAGAIKRELQLKAWKNRQRIDALILKSSVG